MLPFKNLILVELKKRDLEAKGQRKFCLSWQWISVEK